MTRFRDLRLWMRARWPGLPPSAGDLPGYRHVSSCQVADETIASMKDAPPGEQETSAQQETGGGTWPLEGFFTCGSGLLVGHECLGLSFQTRTATYELTITLPTLDAMNALAPLRRPPWKFNREGQAPAASVDEEWGELGSLRTRNSDGTWPDYPALVRQCIVATSVEARNDEQFMTAAKVVADELALWWASLTDWLGVLTVQDFVGLGTQQRSILADGFHAWSGDANGIRRASYGAVVDTVQRYVDVLGQDQLQRAMDLAASGQRPPIEWRFIRDARSLLRAGEYRRAVIDAATAAELTLTELLDRHFSATSTDTAISEALLDRSQTLGGRCKLVNELMPGTLPGRFQQEVTEPRNLAAHTGHMLTRVKRR
jgi:hypothetical protein